MELYCNLILGFDDVCTGYEGDGEARTPVLVESPVGYLSYIIGFLTCSRDPAEGQCQVGSLTGAVASERVTEASKGSLSADRNRAKSIKAEGSLTARLTGRAGTKVGLSDPVE